MPKIRKSGGNKLKNIKRLVSAVAIFIFAFSAVGCNMIEKTPEAIGKTVVAKVGDKKITRAELDSNFQTEQLVEQLKQQYGENYMSSTEASTQLKQTKIQILNSMTIEEALIQEAEKLKVVPKEEEFGKLIDEKLAEYKQSQGITDDAKFQEMLKEEGIALDTLKGLIKRNIILEKLQTEVVKSVAVDDKAVEEYYNKNKDRYPQKAEDPTKLTLSHILVPDQAQAQAIKAELDKGGNFADLAKKYGTDGTKDLGGELGEIPTVNHGFDEDFMTAAMQLKEGETSGLVKTQFGYHLIKCTKRVDKPVKALAEVKEEVKTSLLGTKKSELWNKKLEEVKANIKITLYEDKVM
jgi:foldase protein PrsA